jgi:hypothetical protein
VQGTLSTYLEFFINPEIAEVFCANEPTFSIGEIDAGKIVCIAMPQKFQSERLYINTILKLSYYFHALSRFDKPATEREKANLIVLFADEGQEIITVAESAFADHRAAGIIREARATIAAFEFLVRRGIHKALGVRPMKKTVQKFIGDAVRDAMRAGAPSSGVLTVSPLNDRLIIM